MKSLRYLFKAGVIAFLMAQTTHSMQESPNVEYIKSNFADLWDTINKYFIKPAVDSLKINPGAKFGQITALYSADTQQNAMLRDKLLKAGLFNVANNFVNEFNINLQEMNQQFTQQRFTKADILIGNFAESVAKFFNAYEMRPLNVEYIKSNKQAIVNALQELKNKARGSDSLSMPSVSFRNDVIMYTAGVLGEVTDIMRSFNADKRNRDEDVRNRAYENLAVKLSLIIDKINKI